MLMRKKNELRSIYQYLRTGLDNLLVKAGFLHGGDEHSWLFGSLLWEDYTFIVMAGSSHSAEPAAMGGR